MKQRRHTPEQVIRKLREADGLLAQGQSVAEVARALEVSEPGSTDRVGVVLSEAE